MSDTDTIIIPGPSIDTPGAVVACGPFWPDISLSDLRETMRIGNSTITSARLKAAIAGAVLTVDKDLSEWRAAREAEGHETLSACPAPQIGGESRLIALYRRAVYAYAAADLIETHGDITATGAGVDKTAHNVMTADDHRRNGVHAIRDVLGLRRIKARMV